MREINSESYLNKLQVIGGNVSSQSPESGTFRLTRSELLKMFDKRVTEKELIQIDLLFINHFNPKFENHKSIKGVREKCFDIIMRIPSLNKSSFVVNFGDRFMENMILRGCYEAIKKEYERHLHI